MTTMEITASVCSFCDAVASKFKSIIKNWQFARQMSANRHIAEYLWHSGEYRSYHEALESLNRKTLEQMKNV